MFLCSCSLLWISIEYMPQYLSKICRNTPVNQVKPTLKCTYNSWVFFRQHYVCSFIISCWCSRTAFFLVADCRQESWKSVEKLMKKFIKMLHNVPIDNIHFIYAHLCWLIVKVIGQWRVWVILQACSDKMYTVCFYGTNIVEKDWQVKAVFTSVLQALFGASFIDSVVFAGKSTVACCSQAPLVTVVRLIYHSIIFVFLLLWWNRKI